MCSRNDADVHRPQVKILNSFLFRQVSMIAIISFEGAQIYSLKVTGYLLVIEILEICHFRSYGVTQVFILL